ncbi:MAG: hypothetical protein WKF61_02575 [Luteimonas sp.]
MNPNINLIASLGSLSSAGPIVALGLISGLTCAAAQVREPVLVTQYLERAYTLLDTPASSANTNWTYAENVPAEEDFRLLASGLAERQRSMGHEVSHLMANHLAIFLD